MANGRQTECRVDVRMPHWSSHYNAPARETVRVCVCVCVRTPKRCHMYIVYIYMLVPISLMWCAAASPLLNRNNLWRNSFFVSKENDIFPFGIVSSCSPEARDYASALAVLRAANELGWQLTEKTKAIPQRNCRSRYEKVYKLRKCGRRMSNFLFCITLTFSRFLCSHVIPLSSHILVHCIFNTIVIAVIFCR